MSQRILHSTFIGLLVLAMVAGIPFPGRAACPPADLQSQLTAADVVATGTVYSLVPLDEGGYEAYLDPVTIYKGADLVSDSLIVSVPDNAAERVQFVEGDAAYLLFLRMQDDGTFAADACAGSRELGSGLTDAEKPVLGSGTDFLATVPPVSEGDQLPSEELTAIAAASAEPIDQRAATWLTDHRLWAVALFTWILLSHGLALWAAARLNQRWWFVVLLVVPTIGVLPVVYLARIGRAAFPRGGQTPPPTA